MSDSLLPPNASDLELAVEKVLSRTEQIPVTIDTLWDPETAPENTLPWLAWALSVDEWSSAWSVETKRKVIANSVEQHRKKGTRGAVELSLASIDVDTEIKEWFEQIPIGDVGTFKVVLDLSDRGVSAEQIVHIVRAVNGAKSVRSHYVLDAVMGSSVDLFPVLASSFSQSYLLEPYQDLDDVIIGLDVCVGCGVQFVSDVFVNHFFEE